MGVDLDAVDTFGETPLHIAVKAANLRSIKDLLAKGANKKVRNNEDQIPADQISTHISKDTQSALKDILVSFHFLHYKSNFLPFFLFINLFLESPLFGVNNA